MKFNSYLARSALAAVALAHGGVLYYSTVNPVAWIKGFTPYNSPTGQVTMQREWDSYNPILDPTQTTMQCNANGAFGAFESPIAAGSKITAYWNNPWPHTLGPVTVWLSACGGNCTQYNPSGAVWFKINQAGLISGTLSSGLWGMGQLVSGNSSWTVTIPASLKPGNYLIRHELLALHTSNQPQWYPECGQLSISGSGTSFPSSAYMASIPGVYSMSQPNINIDVYSNANSGVTNYTIVGPNVWTG